MAGTLDSALMARLREALAGGSVTEADLRKLGDEAEGRQRSLEAQVRAGEQRLARLTAEPRSPITEIAEELHRVDALRPQLEEVRALLAELETRGRELRASWLARQR